MTTYGFSDQLEEEDRVDSHADHGRESTIARVLLDTMAYARERDYTGWDYGDGMSSRLLQALPFNNRGINLVVQELVKRSPVNLRPLFLVEQRRNHKGAALFAMANLTLHELQSDLNLGDGQDRPDYLAEARRLLDWLISKCPEGYSGFCLGHQHAIQDIQGLADVNEPDSVCTSFGVKALLRGSGLDSRYAPIARTAERFVMEDLDYRPTEHGARITYSQNHDGSYYTYNAGALAGRLFVDLFAHTGDRYLLDRGREILDHIAAKQEQNGGWVYRDPPSASHLSMDTHHNGFILECFQRYAAVTDSERYADVVDRALSFHRESLFTESGAPNFDEKRAYPRDIHAAAQGILVFTYADDLAFARRILEWTLRHLYAGDGRFYFRKLRLYTNRVTLMRWCEAWMAFAMSEHLKACHAENPIGN